MKGWCKAWCNTKMGTNHFIPPGLKDYLSWQHTVTDLAGFAKVVRHPCVSVRKGQPPRNLPRSLRTYKRDNGLEKRLTRDPQANNPGNTLWTMQITKRLYKLRTVAQQRLKMIHYRPRISHVCPHNTIFIYKPTRGLLAFGSPSICCAEHEQTKRHRHT